MESDTPIPVWRHSERCWDKKTVEEHYERESRETVCRFLSKSDEITQKHKHSNNYHKLSEFKMAFKLNFYSLTSTVHVFQVDASDMLYLNLV